MFCKWSSAAAAAATTTSVDDDDDDETSSRAHCVVGVSAVWSGVNKSTWPLGRHLAASFNYLARLSSLLTARSSKRRRAKVALAAL